MVRKFFKQKIVIKIPKIDHQAAFSPIDVLDFDLVKNYDKSGVEFIDAIWHKNRCNEKARRGLSNFKGFLYK